MIVEALLLAQLAQQPAEQCPEQNNYFRFDWATQQYVWDQIIKNCVIKEEEPKKKIDIPKLDPPYNSFRS